MCGKIRYLQKVEPSDFTICDESGKKVLVLKSREISKMLDYAGKWCQITNDDEREVVEKNIELIKEAIHEIQRNKMIKASDN